MNKKEYLEELRKELKKYNVNEVEDIIADYEEHFENKMEEGFTEEEIARKLSVPEAIAIEYAESNGASVNKYEKGAKTAGVVAMSIPLTMLYIVICASVVVLGAFSIACLATGICLITTINVAGLIPSMPYFSALAIGIACIGLSVLSAVGTYYMYLYVKQWGKVYVRWCKNIINNNRYPSLSMHPQISKKRASKLKIVAVMGLVCFVAAFVIGYVSLCIAAGSLEPWHVFNWFN